MNYKIVFKSNVMNERKEEIDKMINDFVVQNGKSFCIITKTSVFGNRKVIVNI